MRGGWLLEQIINRFLTIPDCIDRKVQLLDCFERDLLINWTRHVAIRIHSSIHPSSLDSDGRVYGSKGLTCPQRRECESVFFPPPRDSSDGLVFRGQSILGLTAMKLHLEVDERY